MLLRIYKLHKDIISLGLHLKKFQLCSRLKEGKTHIGIKIHINSAFKCIKINIKWYYFNTWLIIFLQSHFWKCSAIMVIEKNVYKWIMILLRKLHILFMSILRNFHLQANKINKSKRLNKLRGNYPVISQFNCNCSHLLWTIDEKTKWMKQIKRSLYLPICFL